MSGNRAKMTRKVKLYSLMILVGTSLSVCSALRAEEKLWYQGCYQGSAIQDGSQDSDSALQIRSDSGVSAVSCSKLCLAQRSPLAAVSMSGECLCLPSLPEVRLENGNCSHGCSDVTWLACGGSALSTEGSQPPVSVYASAGPFMLNMSIAREHGVFVGKKTVLQVNIQLAAVPSSNLGSGLPLNGVLTDPATLKFNWSTGDRDFEKGIVADDVLVESTWITVFEEAGVHTIDAVVSNGVSQLSSSIEIDVRLPIPSSPQLVLLGPQPEDRPSCIPPKFWTPDSGRFSSVFAGQRVTLEASVAVGANLTFTWNFGDGMTLKDVVTARNASCSGRMCLISSQVHEFEEGQYDVTVAISSDLGQVQDSLRVVAVQRLLDDLRVRYHGNATVRFHSMVQYSVTMFTTELHDKVLAVNHGDESPPLVVPLWEIGPHGNDTDETQPASDMVRLAEEYGENNCQLVISVGHIHTQQGTFWSSVSVSSRSRPNVSLEASTVKPVTIEAPLEGLTVHCDPVVSNNMPVNFTAQLSVVSPNVTFAWEVQAAANQPMLQPANSVMHSRTALSNDLFVVTFINVGQYNITVIAENGLNRIQDDVVVRVVAPIAGLSVGPKDNSRYVTLGEAITLQAVLINGSHPTFSWDLQDNMTSTLITDSALMSTVVHSFSAAGDYNVTVEATNNYNSVIAHTQKPIVVQEPVANLIVKVTGAARPGESTTVDAMVTAGSHVNFDFDFGNGRQPSSGNGQTSVTEVHSFNTAGSHAVTVYAYNQVSEIQRVAHVVVQNRVGAMTLSTYPLTPVIGHTTVFAVKLDDVVPDRTDLDYKWTLDGHLLEYTGGPLLKKIFTLSGVFNLSVMAKNQVDRKTLSTNITIQESSSDPFFNHSGITRLTSQTPFIIYNVPQNIDIDMDYGDQDERTSPPIHWDGTGPFKISHLYAHAGVYTVRAIYQHPYTSESVSVITMVSVQEAISGLRIDGPSAVPNVRYHAGTNHSIARQYAWQAVRTAGSDIVYNWTASGPGVHKSEVTAEAQMMREFLAAGVYTLTVKAHNGPGVVHAKKFVHVQFPITRMFIRTEPTILGKASAVFVVVTGGVCRSYSIDFGDANSAHFSCNDSIRELQAPTPDIAGNYSLNISHVYAKVGEYPIRVNVTNAVSSKTIKGVITVEEAISGIQLETSASDVVRLGDIITASVTVATGNNLTFDWLFGSSGFSSSPISVNSSSRSSTATGSLRELGMHSIHVAISSPIYERLGIVVSKSLSFLVHRPIQAVDITALTSKGEPVSSAVLTRDTTGNLTTGAINFLAVAQEGTDVRFYYDFGDGTNRTDVGIYSSLGFSTSKSVVQHAYSRTGDFVVFVRASNPLGDRTAQLDFCVQSAPEGLQLDKDIYSTAFGNVSRFSVSITGGIEVLFDWNMGDGTTKTNAGQSVSHTYTSVGVFNVSVLAFNRVARRSTWSLVKVQSVIQGVELQVIEPVHRYLSSVEFIAKPDPPENNIADYYYFELGETAIATQAKSIFYTYQKHGHYTAKVTAYNNNGQAVSDVEPIHVVEIMSAVLTIEIEGDTVIGQEIRFRAYHFKGSDMTYRWDFGDGEVVNTSHAVTGHTFSKKGAYRVVVVAANFFSNQTKELDVFVLEDICRAPLLEILGEDNQKIPRSKDVIVEVKVELDCLITTTTIYEWKVYNSSESNPVPISGLDKQLFHDPVLVLPRRWLDYGFYSVELRVDMNDTIVHASERTTFEVVASSLMPVISGGILRRCCRQDVVVMDASLSHDPDYPGDMNGLEYAWRCYELDATESSCFIGNDSTLRSGKILEIPGDKFKANVKDFVFELTVSKAGREESTVTQVLKLEASETIDVNILCEQCEDLVVNADERLVLKTQVGSLQQLHRRGSLLFSWNLYFVVNGTRPIDLLATPGDEQLSSCLIDLGTPFNLVSNDTDPLTPMVTSSTTSTTTTTAATTSSTTTTASLFNPLYPFGTLDEGESGGRSGGGGAGGLGGFNPGEDTGGGGRGASGSSSGGLGPSEGAGGGRGTGSGQTGGETDNTGSSENTQGGPGDDVSDGNARPKADKHIVRLTRVAIQLRDEHTTTELGSDVLVLKKGLLLKGYTYIVEVNVEDTERGIEGSALTYFKVNSSPSRGGCTIRPKSAKAEEPGVEMETVYKVFCQEWRDEDAPIRYEVAYSVDGSEAIDLIYQGLNHEISFTLPAGNLLNDFKVEVFVNVLDSLGARSRVCATPLRVLPKGPRDDIDNRSQEEILFDLVSEDSKLSKYLGQGDNRNARLLTNMVAGRLNRLPPQEVSSLPQEQRQQDNNLRFRIRGAILDALWGMPMRDEYEIQQMTSALKTTTEHANELTSSSLQNAAKLLDVVSMRMNDLTTDLDTGLADIAVHGASNVLQGAQQLGRTSSDKQMMKSIVATTEAALQKLLKAELKRHVTGERPVNQTTPALTAYGNRYLATDATKIESTAATFSLPADIVKRTPESCMEAHMITYARNPYVYAHDDAQDRKVQTAVASLTLFSCDGVELSIQDLPDEREINIEIPHNPIENGDEPHVLVRSEMNIHQFNFTSLSSWQPNSLHVSLNLVHVPEGRLFPIAVLLRPSQPPTPDDFSTKWVFAAGDNEISIKIPQDTMNGSRVFYLGVVDASFNAGRPREGEVRRREYRLQLWQGQCLYWDQELDDWSSQGCKIISEHSSYYKAHCSCNHLTSFGAHFALSPNTLDFKNIDDFFDLHTNPVTFSFILAILITYGILMVIAVQKDNQDAAQPPIVELMDNSPSDKQKYLVSLETGFRKGAATTAKVSLVLHGEEGMSETRELVGRETKPIIFQRHSRQSFILTLPENLGRLFKCQIWHNNAGEQPSWYLSRVIVQDLNTGYFYYFMCERWFAADIGDGKVEREIMASEGGLGFSKVLWAKGTQYFADYHLWFSTFSRPPHSRFTRAQRLTCCLSLLMSYMALNCVWYKGTEKDYRGEFGMIDLSWRAVVVGAIISLIALPANLIIVMLFRRSKVNFLERPHSAFNKKYKTTKRNDSVSSIGSTDQSLGPPVMSPSLFDQTISNWQSLQDWAQKTWTRRNPDEEDSIDKKAVDTSTLETNISDRIESVMKEETKDVTPPLASVELRKKANDAEIELRPIPPRHIKSASSSSSNSSNLSDIPLHQPPSRQTLQAPTPPSSIHSTPPRTPARTHHSGVIRSRSQRGSERSHTTMDDSSQGSSSTFYGDGPLRSDRCFLPQSFAIIAWILCFLVISGCSSLTVLYGFKFGRTKSILWLQSLFFSFMQCVSITHPLLVLLLSVIVAMRNRNNIHIFSHHDDGYLDQKVLKMLKSKPKSKEDDEDESVNLEEGVAARQRSRYLRFARPPQETELLKSRNDILKQKGASAFINETLLFTVQFVLLVLIAFGKNPTHAFGIHRHVTATLAQDGEHPLAKVHSISQMWKWMQGHFTDTMYDDPTRPGFLSNSYLIGQVQLRQHRFTNQLCDVQVEKLLVSGNCRGDMEMDAFGMNQSYWYHSAELTGAGRVQGQHDDYGGDGYLVKLPNRRLPAEAQLKKLEEDGWVNSMTSAVIAEFTTFHVPSNIFNTVRILFEIPAFGGMTPSLKISSAYLYKYVSVMDNLLLACELLLIVCTMLKVRHEVMEMLRLKAEYFHNVWNALETSQCLLSLAFVGCFMFRFLLVGAKVQDLRSTYKEQFMDVSDVHEWDEVLRTIIGFILFLVTLQLVKALRHQPPFSVFAKVYHRAAMDILVFALMFFIWLASYTCLTMALYSALSMQFKSVDNTILSLLALLTGSYDFDNLAFGNFWGVFVWRLVIVSFMMFVIGSLTAYMLAILNYHYKRHHSEKKVTFNLTESVRFCRNRLSNVFRLRAASSEDPPSSASASASGKTEPETLLPTEFTMAEIEYQVDEMLFKMNALAGTSNLPEKPPIYYTDSDTCIYGGVGGSGEGDSSTTASSEVQGFNPLQELRGNHKIEYIFSEPHLSKLLQLDSIGADVLNVPEADVEKQLRNQLEMEIFRQLQLQRQEGRYPSSSGSGVGEGEGEVGGGEGGVVGVGERGSEASDVYASSLSSSGCNHSPTPASVGGAKSHTIDESDSVTCNDPLPILNSIPFHPEPPAPPQVKPSAPHSIGGRKLQQRKDKKKKKKKVHSASSSEALVVEEMPDSVIGIRSDSADSSSCCSGSHKAANRGNSLHPGMPVPPLHPCSNTTPAESKRAVKSKKSSQAQLHKKTPVPQYNEGGLNQILNSWDDLDFSCSTSPSSSPSSSSSESEEQTPPAQSKAQQHSTRGTLRKTRSRGGGKGQGHTVAACDLLSLTEDEFAFDNHGYASEGDRVRAGQKKYRKPPPPATKQCWS